MTTDRTGTEPGLPRKGKDVGCVTSALEVLSCFSLAKPEWGVTEIATHLGMFKSAVHRLLRTLEMAGYVEATESRRYRLGIRVLELGNIFRLQTEILSAADNALHWLSEKTGFTAHLFQMDGRDSLELQRFGTPKDAPPQESPVLRRMAHSTAVGKVLLASSNEMNIENYIGFRKMLHRYTAHTIHKPDHLRAHLRQVREQGYATNLQESSLGRVCIGVPVTDRSGRLIAALSISTSPNRVSVNGHDAYLPVLQAAASRIRANLR